MTNGSFLKIKIKNKLGMHMMRTGIHIFKIIDQKAYISTIIVRVTLVVIPKVSNGAGVKVYFVSSHLIVSSQNRFFYTSVKHILS